MLPAPVVPLLFASLELAHAAPDTTLIWAVFAATAGVAAAVIMYHSPHDVIEDVRIAMGARHGKTVFVVSRHNLLRSTEDGAWKRLTDGLGAYKLSSLTVSPGFETDHTLFVASFGGGVFRSRNGGLSWAACNDGIADAHIVLLGISPDFQRSRVVVALGRGGALYGSRDGGGTWETICERDRVPWHSLPSGSLNSDHDDHLLDPVRDAGEAWQKCHRTMGISCMAFATDAMVIGTSDGMLYASRDQGASWCRFASVPQSGGITCIEIPQDVSSSGCFFVGTKSRGVFRILHDGDQVEPTGRVKALTHVTAMGSFFDAGGDLNLLACSWDEALFVSRDRGASWIQKGGGLTKHRQADEHRFGAPHFSAIAVCPSEFQTEVYVGGFDGLFHTRDLDHEWESVETLPLGIVISFALFSSRERGLSIAAATYGAGVCLLPDDAQSWQIRNSGLITLRLGTIRFSPDYAIDRTLFTVSEGRVLRSIDAGPWEGTTLLPAATTHGLSVRLFARLRAAERLVSRHLSTRSVNRLKSLFQAGVLRMHSRVNHYVFPTVLAFSPNYRMDRTLFVGTRAHGVFRSEDGGNSFSQIWDCPGRFVFSLAVSPRYSTDGLLYASLSDGLYRIRDGGSTWENTGSGKHFRSARLVMSPSFDTDHTLFLGGLAGLWRSRDGGEHWQLRPVGTERETMAIGGIALSPAFGTDGHVLVHAHGEGLYRSTDGGDTFEPLPWLAPGLSPAETKRRDHAFAPMLCFPDADTLFQFSPDYAEDRTLVAASLNEIYLSRDAGLTWTRVAKPTRYEASRAEITYRGHWSATFDDAFSAQRAHHACSPLDEATLRFVGAGVSWIGTRGPDHGMAAVFVDEELRATVDLYAPQRECNVALFSTPLPHGHHEITVRVQRAKNDQSSGRKVEIDAFDVEP